MNSLTDWLDCLENRYQQEIQLGLDRILTVAIQLNLIHWDATVITVAGTNGKGSTVAALEAIYRAAGYQVACYTSPHLIAFNERIRVNNQLISDDHLCDALTVIEQNRADIPLTYFEMVTLAALWYFKQFTLDLLILEVGMGGRMDATNIIDSDLAIITTIDLDHQDYLGDTIEAIAAEKAGILRLNKPFIYADKMVPASILQRAKALNAPMVSYTYATTENSLQVTRSNAQQIEVPLPAIHSSAAASAIVASLCLQDVLPVSLKQCQEAMSRVSIRGRQQVVFGPVSTIFDVAHNPQSVSLLADFIKDYPRTGKVHAVFSGLKDKDLCGLITPMHPYVDIWYPALLEGKRAPSKSFLLGAFSAFDCLIYDCFNSPSLAYQMAMQQAKTGDLVVVYGSFLTVSAVMTETLIEYGELQ